MARKKQKELPEEVSQVSSGKEEDLETVEPIEIDNLESLLSPTVVSNSEHVLENSGMDVGIIIPEDKMTHRKISMQCNSCFISDSCPQYKEDSPCTIDWGRLFNGEFRPTDLLQSAVSVLDLQLMRIQRAATFESLNQGILDPELSRLIQVYFEMIEKFKSLSERPQSTISITAKGDAAKGGGVLSQLLGLK